MSINKIYLPEVKVLKKYLKENGSERFYYTYIRKREAFIGDSNSVDFVDQFCKTYFKDDNQKAT